MKLIILRLDAVNKPSPMSENVVEIWINSQPCKGINLTIWHTQVRKAPRVATVHDMTKKSGRVLPGPSVIFHVYASTDTPWVAQTLSYYTPVKWVRYHPTHRHTMLLSLRIPYVTYVLVHFKCLFIRTQPTWALTDTGRSYYLRALNFRSDHSPSFSSSILHFPLIAPPGLQLCQPFYHLAKSHRTSIDRKGPIVSGFQQLIFYRYPI
jgi:hypothetical protein